MTRVFSMKQIAEQINFLVYCHTLSMTSCHAYHYLQRPGNGLKRHHNCQTKHLQQLLHLFLRSCLLPVSCINSSPRACLQVSSMTDKVTVTLRDAVESDLDEVHQMLADLIAYQKLPHPAMDKALMKRDSGLTADQPHPYFHTVVAETGDHLLAGYALYYFLYKTSKGKFLYLEDIYVKDEFRGSCVGFRLMQRMAEISVQHQAIGIKLQCLHNNSAKKFYERCGAVWNGIQIGDWLEYEIVGDAVVKLQEKMDVLVLRSPHQ